MPPSNRSNKGDNLVDNLGSRGACLLIQKEVEALTNPSLRCAPTGGVPFVRLAHFPPCCVAVDPPNRNGNRLPLDPTSDPNGARLQKTRRHVLARRRG